MNILITGGAGFIGSHLTEYHLNLGDHVTVVDNFFTGSGKNLQEFLQNPNLTIIDTDILQWLDIESHVNRADRIYHLAAIVGVDLVLAKPTRVLEVNIGTCERILQAAILSPKNPVIVITSSSEVYGKDYVNPSREDDTILIPLPLENRSNYAISKIVNEAYGLSYLKIHGLKIITVRLFNTVGPKQTGYYGMVVPRLVAQAIQNKPLCVFGDGTQTRSFCDVRDCVMALDKIANNSSSIGKTVNVGHDQEISIQGLAELIRERAQSSSIIQHVPYSQAYSEVFQDTLRRRPDLSLFNKLSQFKHQWTIKRTLDNLISQGHAELAKP